MVEMWKNKVIICFILSAIISLSIVCAENTDIKVRTMDDFNLSILINVVDVNTNTIKSFNEFSNYQEELNFTYNSSQGRITLSGYVMGTGVVIKKKYFGNYSTGSLIVLDMFDDSDYVSSGNSNTSSSNITTNSTINAPAVNSSNSTISQINIGSTITTNASAKSNFFSKFSLNTLKLDKAKLLKIVYWIIGIAVIIIAGFFAFRLYKNKKSWGQLHLLDKFSNSKKEDIVLPYSKPENSKKIESELAEAERKIKEAQATLDEIRNRKQKRIEAEKKLEAAKRELAELNDEE